MAKPATSRVQGTEPRILKGRDLLWIAAFYFVFSVLYRIVLWYNGGNYEAEGFWGWADPRGYWYGSGMQYLFYLVASIFIWFLGVYLLRHRPVRWQLVAVALLIPATAYLVREIRYMIVDSMGLGRLSGTGAVWDWYIPSLILMIQFGCFFAYRYFRENERKIKLEGELRQAALKSELTAIKAQLNPHFLYNVFNTINASIPPENEKTRNMIAQLSDLFRYQLQASQQETVPLREELDFVRKYLRLEKARFGERLSVDIDVPGELLEEPVPPMLLQPLVENSVKHGLSSLIEGGAIYIRIFKEGEKLRFEISDTGVGIRDKARALKQGIGLANTATRLQKAYQSQLELLDNNPRGLTVRFAL